MHRISSDGTSGFSDGWQDNEGDTQHGGFKSVGIGFTVSPLARPFYVKFEQDHKGQRWTVQEVVQPHSSTWGNTVTVSAASIVAITGTREDMRWLVDELTKMLDASSPA